MLRRLYRNMLPSPDDPRPEDFPPDDATPDDAPDRSGLTALRGLRSRYSGLFRSPQAATAGADDDPSQAALPQDAATSDDVSDADPSPPLEASTPMTATTPNAADDDDGVALVASIDPLSHLTPASTRGLVQYASNDRVELDAVSGGGQRTPIEAAPDARAHEAAGSDIKLVATAPEGEDEEERDSEGRGPTLEDYNNLNDWYNAYDELAKIDPKNPALEYITPQNWFPSEKDVQDIRAALAKAEARLNGLSSSQSDLPAELQPWNVQENAPKATKDIISPFGSLVGFVKPGTTPNVRTVSSADFRQIENDLLDGAKSKNLADYDGWWFVRPDGSQFGLRSSSESGDTIDVDDPSLPRGLKVHQNGN